MPDARSTARDPSDRIQDSLRHWLPTVLDGARDVAVEGLDRVDVGHSAETLLATITWRDTHGAQARDVVLRLRPPTPGLLEPYDLHRQFTILRALEPTPVPAPRVLWEEPTGTVLGREFYVMERLAGTVYEDDLPPEIANAPDRLARMSASLVETIAAIHRVDLDAAGLATSSGRDYLTRELDHWTAEIGRVQRDRLPALERLAAELRDRQPEPCPTVTLVHGDPKPGNFGFVDNRVHAVFDWELATVGDPLADVGWAEANWSLPSSFTSRPGSLTPDEFVARYEQLTSIAVRHREWYRSFQTFKMATIMLVAAMRFDAGTTDDLRFATMGLAVHHFTVDALHRLGIDDAPPSGPVTARRERVRSVRARQHET